MTIYELEYRRRLVRRILSSLTLSALLAGASEGANLRKGVAPPALPRLAAPIAAPRLPFPAPSAPTLPEGVGRAPRAQAAPLVPAEPLQARAVQAQSPLSPAAQLQAAAPSEQAAEQPQHKLDAVFDGAQAPATRRDETVVDDYHGTKIADPYRWLEDDNSEETKTWVKAQNAVTESVLAGIPERDEIAHELKAKWNYERFSAPQKIGGWWVYSRNDGLQDQSVLYKSRRLYGEREVLLDPNALSSDGTVSLAGAFFSPDGKYLAYGLSKAGSDWVEWRVKGVNTGEDLPDKLEWTKFTYANWDMDGKGFWYTRYPAPPPGQEKKGKLENAAVYYHRIGTPQSQDVLVHEDPESPKSMFAAASTADGRYLLLYERKAGSRYYSVSVRDLTKPGSPFIPLYPFAEGEFGIIGNEGETFYVRTTHKAPRGKLVAVTLGRPQPRYWNTIIPQSRGKEILESVVSAGDRFVAKYMVDVKTVLRVYGPRGGLKHEVKLPGAGDASNWSARSNGETTHGFINFTSFNHPTTNFRLNLKTGKLRRYRPPQVDFNPKKYEVNQVWYASKDGTKIPMYVVHKKGLKLDGANPTLLYGYGGFKIAKMPNFSMARTAWLDRGGVYAMPALRGGGEYGQEWHDAGRLANKQNVFDDFIAAAEWLIERGYTRPDKLAINGGSNGGLLVGAVMTQRPELFGAAIPEVGVLDMLRYHLFTIGAAWKPDYGTAETKEGFDVLIKYSPLHNVKPGTRYPATMVMTGDHDDRVVPAHSHKFTATLQAAQPPGAPPILTRVEENAGHGAGTPLSKILAEAADRFAFLLRALGVSRAAPPSA